MDLEPPLAFEVGSYAVLALVVVADLVLAYRRPGVPTAKASALWFGFYTGLALAFAAVLLALSGAEYAGQFVTGWATAFSLSIDNLFVFAIIMATLAVPRRQQHAVLLAGIVLALLVRGVVVVAGAVVIEQFSAVFYLFGLFLIYTAVNQAIGSHHDEEEAEHRVIAFLRRRIATPGQFDGARIRTVVDGRRVFTPVIIVIIAIGTTDIVFALDSVPAVYGITQSPFLVFTANFFALMGLRQLYFLLRGLLDTLAYLKYGVAAVLAFIGVKLFFHALRSNELPFVNGGENVSWAPEIGTYTSLAVILAAMLLAALLSLIALRRESRRARTASTAPEPGRESKGPRHR
jgi:tellurite resistance protein TerC